ncbi:MAG: ABC transporter permease subunit [Paracoccaceae bacterium]
MLRLFTAIPYVWLVVLFLVPFGIVAKIALSDYAISIPPYTPTLDLTLFTFEGNPGQRFWHLSQHIDSLLVWWTQIDLAGDWERTLAFFGALDFENFVFLTEDDLYWRAYLSSVQIALISTFLTLCVGFPIAYAMSRAPEAWRPALMMLVILPFWTSFLIRVYAWIGILANEGFLNQFLLWLGLISEPLQILNTTSAVYIGIVYTYLPFMILPIYASLDRMDPSLLEAAEDLGCSRLTAFWHVTWPLARPGVIAGCFLVFIPTVGEFVIPSLLGGSDALMIGKVLWEEFFSNRDWPVASAVAIILLVILIVPIVLFQRHETRQRERGA